MLRERRRHANYKPNRRLDRKSSRGMIYENEELRLRTININAEVEQGRSDIRKLRRENEQLKREIWNLRDEYDRINRKASTEEPWDNCLESDSQSDTDDCESCQANKLFSKCKSSSFDADSSKKSQQSEVIPNVPHSGKFRDFPFVLSADEFPLNMEVYENNENLHKTMKEPFIVKPSLAVSEQAHHSSNLLETTNNKIRDVYPPNISQLSVLSEENLTGSDCISCVNDNLENASLRQNVGSSLDSAANTERLLESFIHTSSSRDPLSDSRIHQTDSCQNDQYAFDIANRQIRTGKPLSPDIQNTRNFFSTIRPRSNETLERQIVFKNPPDLFVSNALASPHQHSVSAVATNYDCTTPQNTQDGNLGNFMQNMENIKYPVDKRKSVSQEKLSKGETLSRSKLFRSEISLFVSCDGAKPCITRIDDGKPPYICQLDEMSFPHTSLPILSSPQHMPPKIPPDKTVDNEDATLALLKELALKCDLSDAECMNMGPYPNPPSSILHGFNEPFNEKRLSFGKFSIMHPPPSNVNEEVRTSIAQMVVRSSPSSPNLNEKYVTRTNRSNQSKHQSCYRHCIRKPSQDSSKSCQKLRRRFSEGNMNGFSRSTITKASSYDTSTQRTQNQGFLAFPERNSNAIASSRESSMCQSTNSHHRKISESSHGGGKIPWCGCWGNGCL